MKINIIWFRRDLRLEDNTALDKALESGLPVLPLFIFDTNIINELPEDDPRISFIYNALSEINNELKKSGSGILIHQGDPEKVWNNLLSLFEINEVFINKDYEPYAIERDLKIESLLNYYGIHMNRYKDQVIFEEKEILKGDGTPYSVFTPYKKSWLLKFDQTLPLSSIRFKHSQNNFYKFNCTFPTLKDIGFTQSTIKVRSYDLNVIRTYDENRDFPARDKTTYLSPHLRFGTVSIRKVVSIGINESAVFLNELIWREFFMQILFHFPETVTENFRKKYDDIQWINNQDYFKRWSLGETGYPIVDAGMRQLNRTGYMHNRVRMIVAGFLCKHLLTDWRWGEAYFAGKLLDYDLSANIGNWQWAAGTGCDAAPWFRIFNPELQQKKFDPDKEYIRKWIKGFDKPGSQKKIIDHNFARDRAINTYKIGLKK